MIKQFGTEKELWVFTGRLNEEFGGFQDVPWVFGGYRAIPWVFGDEDKSFIYPENLLDWEARASELMKTWVEMYRKSPDTTVQDAVDICEGM
jgi:hypothetical protein